jgi:hypothetical protein
MISQLTGLIAMVAFGNCSIEQHAQYLIKSGAKGNFHKIIYAKKLI